jgi:hypothetical protein
MPNRCYTVTVSRLPIARVHVAKPGNVRGVEKYLCARDDIFFMLCGYVAITVLLFPLPRPCVRARARV